MADTFPSDSTLNAMAGTTRDPGVPVPDDDTEPFLAAGNKFLWRLAKAVEPLCGCEIYIDSTDGALEFSVRAGVYLDDGTPTAYAGSVNNSLTNNQTNYIYLTAAGVLTVNITGWPTTPHVRLGTIVTAAGVYDFDDVVQHRTVLPPAVTMAHRPAKYAVGAVYFSGRPADDELLTIGGRKYEMDDDGDFPAAGGDVQCDLQGNANVDEDITDIAAAINGDGSATVTAVADTANDVLWIYAATAGAAGNAITLVEALTNATVSGATLADGADAALAQIYDVAHVISAAEAAAGFLRFDTGFTSIQSCQVTFLDAGTEAASGVDVTITAGVIEIAENAVAWVAADELHILAVGT